MGLESGQIDRELLC